MMKVAYRNELEKLLCRKKYFVFLFLDVAACLLMAVVQLLTEIFSQGMISSSGLFDGMLFQGFYIYLMFFVPMMAILACADLFSGEYHDLSIRMVLQRPVARWKIFLAKTAAVFTLCVAYVLVHFIAVFLIKMLFGQTFAGTGYALAAYLIDLVPMLVVVLFFAFLHQLVRSPGSAVALSVAAYLVVVCLGKYVAYAGGIAFTEFIGWHSIWLGVTLPPTVLLPKIGILLGTGVALYCAGYELFNRKDI